MKQKLKYVLLIDDDDSVNFINSHIIKKAGIAEKIEIALNGQEALDLLAKICVDEDNCQAPELILLDINMPIMNGWEFLEAYHNLPNIQKGKIVLIMLTTSLNPDDQKKAEAINEVSGFKNKPLTMKTIEEIITTYFPEYI